MVVDLVARLGFAVVVDLVATRVFFVVRGFAAVLLFCLVGFRTLAVREVGAVDLFDAVLEDLALLDLVEDLTVFDLAGDFVDVEAAVFRGDRAFVVF